jgi:uncharacterized SAM-binding protein YcdF (DUF218 family)
MSLEDSPATGPPPSRRYRILFAAGRGLALMLGLFSLLNVLGELRNPGFDANLWWIDLRFTNRFVNRVVMITAGVGLVSFGIRPRFAPFRGWAFTILLGILMLLALRNVWTFYKLTSTGVVHTRAIVPLSALVLLVLGLILWGVHLGQRDFYRGWLDRVTLFAVIGLAAILFPLAQMYCFGLTDYRRPADLIVVFGCYVRPNGIPSMALSDRVKMGVELYKEGCAPKLVFSGGPGPGEIHETEAMRTLAMELGVPADAIELDPIGLSTQATVQNLVDRDDLDQPRILAVSNYYHLPRIKLCFRRAGWEVWTVPANDSNRLYYQERLMLREVAALWWYYLNPN